MKPEINDVQRTLEYGQSHDLARQFFPVPLAGIALGLFLLNPLDGAEPERNVVLIGWASIGFSLAFLGIVIYRRTQPSRPSIVLSPQGVLFRDLSETFIPWDEILEFGIAKVSATRDFSSTTVTKIVVSQRFYESLTKGRWLEPVVGQNGSPSEIYLSYYHTLPFEEFQQAVGRRWHEFSRHAGGKPIAGSLADHDAAPSPIGHPVSGSHSPQAQQRLGAVQRAGTFGSFHALAALVRESSLGQRLVIAASLAGIVALLSNQVGLWSTAAQLSGRARAAEWRARQEQYDADIKATGDEQRRIDYNWDRTFKCMDEYWALHERGTYQKDPDCMKEKQ
ncbi:MAG: hypothetical protein ABL894_01680 [Hyphomicrobium sp.]